MDATALEIKLDFMKFRHNLYGVKTGMFEFSGKIKKVWALSCFFSPGLSSIHLIYNGVTGFIENLLQPKFIMINDLG